MAVAFKAVLIIALTLAGSVGTVTAARDSLPGSVLYPLKIRLEAWDIDRAKTPDDVAKTALAHAGARVTEASRLQSRGDPVPDEVVVRYQQYLELALSTAGGLEAPIREQAEAEISDSVRQQLRVLSCTSARVGGDAASGDAAEPDPGIEALIRTMRATQARLGQSDAPRPDPAVPDNPGNGPNGPAVGDEDPGSGADEPAAPGDQDVSPGGPGPGPANTGQWTIDSGQRDGAQSGGPPDPDALPPTDGDSPDDAGAPGPGPGPGKDNGTGGSGPAPGNGPNGGADDAGGPGSDNCGNGGTGNGSSGNSGNTDSGSRSERSGPTDSGRS